MVATQVIYINIDPSCVRNIDPNMVPSNSLGLDVTMAPGGGTGYSEQYGTAAA